MNDIFQFIFVMALLCPLIHFVAFIIVAPVADALEKRKKNDSDAELIVYFAILLVAFMGTGIITQFFVNLAAAGLLLGAIINVSIALFVLDKRETGGIGSWIAIYATPILGYGLGYYASNNM